jgi:hypothetical protein
MKRAVLLLLFSVFAGGTVGAQGIARLREELARPDSLSGARIEIREESPAAAAVREADRNPVVAVMTVYGVSLFRDNSQNAGESARSVARQFSESHPGIVVAVSYESPYFRVEAGRFIDRTDAVALCGRVLAEFPKAVVVQREIPTGQFTAGEPPAALR